jgi:hypothetical protein
MLLKDCLLAAFAFENQNQMYYAVCSALDMSHILVGPNALIETKLIYQHGMKPSIMEEYGEQCTIVFA